MATFEASWPCCVEGCDRPGYARNVCKRHYRAITGENVRRRGEETVCPCGASFTRSRGSKRTRCDLCKIVDTLNRRCRIDLERILQRLERVPREYVAICVTCGESFTSKGTTARYCSDGCRPVKVKTCRDCKAVIPKNQQRCEPCRDEATRVVRRRQRKKAHKDKNARQRARKYGVPYEPIRSADVYTRDAWRCQLCGKLVNVKAHYLDDDAPTIDHVIPMSLGGGHLWDNVQCAHRRCNSVKGAAIVVQPLLVVAPRPQGGKKMGGPVGG